MKPPKIIPHLIYNSLPYFTLLIVLLSLGFIHNKHVVDLPFTYYNDEAHMLNPSLRMASNIWQNPMKIDGIGTPPRLVLSYCPGYKHFLSYSYVIILPIVKLFNESVNMHNIHNYPLYFIYFARSLNFLFLLLTGLFLIKISKLILSPFLSIPLMLLVFGNPIVMQYAGFAKAELATTTLVVICFYYFLKYYKSNKLSHLFLTVLLASFSCLFKLTSLPSALSIALFSCYLFATSPSDNPRLSKAVQLTLVILSTLLILVLFMPHYFLNIATVLSNFKSTGEIYSNHSAGFTQYELLKMAVRNLVNSTYKIILPPAVPLYCTLLLLDRKRYLFLLPVPVSLVIHLLLFKSGAAFWNHYFIPTLPITLVFSLYVYYESLLLLMQKIKTERISRLVRTAGMIFPLLFSIYVFGHYRAWAVNSIEWQISGFYEKQQANLFYINANVPIGSKILRFRKNAPPINPCLFDITRVGNSDQLVGEANDEAKVFYLIIDPQNYLSDNQHPYFLSTYERLESEGYDFHDYFILSRKDKAYVFMNPYSYSAKQWEDNQLDNIWTTYVPISIPPYLRRLTIVWRKELEIGVPSNGAVMTYIPLSRLKRMGQELHLRIVKKSAMSDTERLDVRIIYENVSGIRLQEENIERFPYNRNILLKQDTLSIANALIVVQGDNVTIENVRHLIDISIE